MKEREFDPLRLDLAAFATEGAELSGIWPLEELPRLAASAHPGPPATGGAVHWSARGERRPRRGGEPDTWLHLRLATRLHLECQRCLQPVETPLEIGRSLRFVQGEEEAAALDAAGEVEGGGSLPQAAKKSAAATAPATNPSSFGDGAAIGPPGGEVPGRRKILHVSRKSDAWKWHGDRGAC